MSDLIEAFTDGARLHVIGEGRLRPLLEEKIIKYGLETVVLLHGSLTQDSVKDQFEESYIFLLPGRHDPKTGRAETQGLVIQEAQAMSLPVIVSDVGGMKYGLLPNKTGFVVPENDIDTFVKTIEQLILSPDLKNNMGKRGRAFVCRHYDNRVLVKKLFLIYDTE